MTISEIEATGATGRFEHATFSQGNATYPCFLIEFYGGWVLSSLWLKPNSRAALNRYIAKHKNQETAA